MVGSSFFHPERKKVHCAFRYTLLFVAMQSWYPSREVAVLHACMLGGSKQFKKSWAGATVEIALSRSFVVSNVVDIRAHFRFATKDG